VDDILFPCGETVSRSAVNRLFWGQNPAREFTLIMFFDRLKNWLFKYNIETDAYSVGEKIKIYVSYMCGKNHNEFGARVCKSDKYNHYKDSICFKDEEDVLNWVCNHKPSFISLICNIEDHKASDFFGIFDKLPQYVNRIKESYWENGFKIFD